jgi:hypothetical protein
MTIPPNNEPIVVDVTLQLDPVDQNPTFTTQRTIQVNQLNEGE